MKAFFKAASGLLAGAGLILCTSAFAAVVQLNSSGGTSTTDGLRIYVEDTSKMQVVRRNAASSDGQLYSPTARPPSNSLDNGIFLRANGRVYGPSHTVGGAFSPTAFSTGSISGPTPANPIADGTSQTATGNYGIASGPQLTVVYSYLRPYDFVTMSVTLVIPSGYAVSAANPVRYYHAVDTYLGGSDNGCGVAFTDTNGRRVVGTYPPASGSTCPSSTSVPAAVTIVESFRERSGQPFSHYCTSLWSNFWDASNPYAACAVMNPASLPDTVTTAYQDTGIAIEYDFTAPGTYTFAYDFVIGSPKVPPYDHLELQYTPGGNLCPMPVKVLGCTSSTVPCPAGSELNANLTGVLSAAGGGGATWTPSANFSIASGTPTTTLTAQPNAPGGTISLGAGSLSAVPLNGVKCWNGSSATCTMTLPNIGCFASDLDACSNLTGSPARCSATGNRLYTKVANQAMSFDLVALKGTPKTVDTSFNSGSGNPVSVDLVTSTATAIGADRCPTSSPVAVSGVTAQTIAFTSGRPASATSYTVPAGQNTRAYRNVWVRFNQGAGGTFCSNDRFAIRPASISTISSGAATADSTGASATATPLVKAGASFTLTADTGTPGYDGLPAITPALVEWLAMPVRIGTLAGSFSTAATAATGNGASGAAFTYDEVGYFRFQPQGVFDDGFTSAYQDASDTVCINTAPNDFSNTANSVGKVGCKFGNTSASNHFGRFVPDHFDISVTQACTTGAFSYSGQPFSVTLVARSAGGTATQNYDKTGAAVFAKANTLVALDSAGSTANPGPGAFVASSNTVAASAFTAGVATTNLPAYTFTAPSTVPTVLRVRSSDSDGVTSLRTAPAITVEGTTTVRSGRLLLANAYGSELLPLAVPARTQYWTTTGWATNVADSCTVLTVPTDANTGLTNALKAKTTASLASPVAAGDVRLRLSTPGAGNAGLVDISGNILRGTNTWLSLPAPTARACFGACGPRSPVIYQRESY
jgi:MSHA biogenesis protein MshQ